MTIRFYSCDGVKSDGGPFLVPAIPEIEIPENLSPLAREDFVRSLFKVTADSCPQKLLAFDEFGNCIAAEVLIGALVEMQPRRMQWLDMSLAYQVEAAEQNRTQP